MAATRLRREHGASGGTSCGAFSDTSWTMWRGIVFSLYPPAWEQKVSKGRAAERPSVDSVAEGVALDHWWTTPQNHCGFELPDVK